LPKVINQVLYWKGIMLRAQGQCIGTSVLKMQAKKGGLAHNLIIIIITQRFYRQLITSLKVIANFFGMSNLMEDDVMSGATDSVEK